MNIPKYIEEFRKELTRKNFSKNTIDKYCSCVNLFLNNFDNTESEPKKINEQQIKQYLGTFTTPNTQRAMHSAIKCFYKYFLNQPNKFRYIEYCRKDKKLPIVLSVDEIQRMFNVCENKKHKAILALLYSCSFRVSELLNLKWSHIDRSRMVINVIQAKGKKDRQVALTSHLISILEEYYREYKSKEYVFNGQGSLQYSEKSVNSVLKQLAEKAKIKKHIHAHLIRHTSATHMLEMGTDINLIQRLLGHSSVKTTSIYTHISHNLISRIPSPLSCIQTAA